MTAPRPSIALRLAIGLSATMAILWIGAALIASSVVQIHLNQAFDETLRQSALRLLPLAVHDIREPEERRERRVTVLEDADEYFTYFVRDRSGRVVVRAEDAPADLSLTVVPDGFSDVNGRRLFAVTDRRTGYGIVVAEGADHRSAALSRSLVALTWPLIGLIPIMAGGIWFAIRLAMRPVERLSRDISQRGSRDLSAPSTAGQPVELVPIAEAVADLLARLGAALKAERAFAASSAHELRTPIAGALAQTQQLAIELGDRPGSRRVHQIESALRHLSQLSEKLLQLSRLDAGFARSDGQVDLMPALNLVVRDFQTNLQLRGRVRLEVAPGAYVRGPINVDAFAVALRNLIHNALIHGADGSPVDVIAGPGARVRVVNSGPVIAADTLARLAEPFMRGDTLAEGSGLGLSIVRSIMDQIGGVLTLCSPAAGRVDGFEAELVFKSADG